MISRNLQMVQTVSEGLGELVKDVVFIGGAVTELYATNIAITEIRPTIDVDCIVEISSIKKYYDFEEILRKKGFKNDKKLNAPICRWIFKDIVVDIMPTDENILGFSNIWYIDGILNSQLINLPNGIDIKIFTIPYFLASKIEAFNARSKGDFRTSSDFEDIIYLLDSRISIKEDLIHANEKVKSYIRNEFHKFLSNPNLYEGITCVLPYGSGDERIEYIIEVMKIL
ncbi:MAG: hypothetical protein KAT68_10250 [Bacteroidales bacterium]|nr:hypothetical protein [Bacteroidales bacterium]